MDSIGKHILDFVETPVFVLEPNDQGLPIYAAINSQALRRLDKKSSDVVGLTAAQIFPGRLGEAAFDHHCATLHSGKARTYDIVLPMQGTQMLFRTTLRPEHDSKGRVIRIFGTSEDVSSSQIFQEMQSEMQTLSNEVEDFVNLAAHDLRAPMRNVQMVAEMLLEDFEDMGDGKLELIHLLADLGEKTARLIGDVLNHAQATTALEQTTQFEFGDLTREIIGMLDPMKTCDITFDEGLVIGDRTATQIILRNLVDNAVKHAGPHKGATTAPRLKLSIMLSSNGADQYCVTVQDNGKGFSDTALIFLEDGKLRTDSGFGLLGVRRLLRSRGGSLTVTNGAAGAEAGAEISFTLPGTLQVHQALHSSG